MQIGIYDKCKHLILKQYKYDKEVPRWSTVELRNSYASIWYTIY